MIFAILSLVILFASAIGLIIYAFNSQSAAVIDERLTNYTEAAKSLDELELEKPFTERVLVPIARSVLDIFGRLSPSRNAEQVRRNLELAGNPFGLSAEMFSGMRLALALGLFLLFGFVTVSTMGIGLNALQYTLMGTIIGYLAPGMWLGNKIKKRQKEITRALPDALDLLTISVEAGLGFDVAMQRVTDKSDNELTREFKRMLNDIRLGRSRREALRDLGERSGVEDLKTFTSAIIQADQLGVSMSKILRLQSDQMRMRRRQRAEEEAQKAPVKMLIPMVFLIFPSLFVVILGPSVPRFIEAFSEEEPNEEGAQQTEPGAMVLHSPTLAGTIDAYLLHEPVTVQASATAQAATSGASLAEL